MMTNRLLRITAIAAAIACASAAHAQQAGERAFTVPAVDGPSCADLSWQEQIVTRYPDIAAACQEVVVANTVRYARFTGELVRVNRDGSVKFDFKDRNGKSLGEATTLLPAASQRAMIQGRAYRFSELAPGQQLSVYVPESRLVIATDPAAPPEAVAKMVFDDPQATQDQPVEPTRLADASPGVRAAQPTRLPETAGWAPLLGVFGVVALMGGILLKVGRRALAKPAAPESTDAGREQRLADELKVLWDKTTTTEVLRDPGLTPDSRRSP